MSLRTSSPPVSNLTGQKPFPSESVMALANFHNRHLVERKEACEGRNKGRKDGVLASVFQRSLLAHRGKQATGGRLPQQALYSTKGGL